MEFAAIIEETVWPHQHTNAVDLSWFFFYSNCAQILHQAFQTPCWGRWWSARLPTETINRSRRIVMNHNEHKWLRSEMQPSGESSYIRTTRSRYVVRSSYLTFRWSLTPLKRVLWLSSAWAHCRNALLGKWTLMMPWGKTYQKTCFCANHAMILDISFAHRCDHQGAKGFTFFSSQEWHGDRSRPLRVWANQKGCVGSESLWKGTLVLVYRNSHVYGMNIKCPNLSKT